jgi:uncharacterized protein YyaL (SSP411 family)
VEVGQGQNKECFLKFEKSDMQATVAMIGSGGWPMFIFLSPDLKPFYTGTYRLPVRRYNMLSFKEILTSLSLAWREEKDEVEKVGEKVAQHLQAQTGCSLV